MQEILALNPPVSPARVDDAERGTLTVALVQHRWHEDQAATEAELEEGIKSAAKNGARIVFLPELTLSKYPAFSFHVDLRLFCECFKKDMNRIILMVKMFIIN